MTGPKKSDTIKYRIDIKEGLDMGQTDKQFGGFLRVIIRDLREARAETDIEKMRERIDALLVDLQATLED